MSDFVYASDGRVHGFRVGYYLYDRGGRAVGRVSAERVYRFDGVYVGELFRNMVVEKPVGARPALRPVAPPPDLTPPVVDSSRGGDTHGFPDVFGRLTEVQGRPTVERPPLGR